ncbi:hypothetical protein [Paraflavitalea speifideaquila]|uniref:hypothetical protein n=1 Tax=Paraflavitalea speifideaquila TaxID=3076558 RepID=UPI0028E8461E|nr:hypothetical protein [Paraflavitalea speifideiaquila]
MQRNADGSGWLAPDLKLAWLADKTGNTPKFYPSTGILPAIESDDKRFYEYYGYTPALVLCSNHEEEAYLPTISVSVGSIPAIP